MQPYTTGTTGTTGVHSTTTGAKMEATKHQVASHVPGTHEHAATHGTTHHVVQTPTGEVHHHKTKVGAKLDEAMQKTKEAIPGTDAHKATHGPYTGAGATHTTHTAL